MGAFLRNEERTLFYINGWFAVFFLLIAIALMASLFGTIPAMAAGVVLAFTVSGFRIIQPNMGLVATCFGKYAGSLTAAGFYWTIPFIYQMQKVSLRTKNYTTPTIKVNDASGTPIEIAAAIVYHISNPAASVLDVEQADLFLHTQSESALRTLSTQYPYSSAENESLANHSEHIVENFRNMVQERVDVAGITIDEARFTHLAYAPEIAQAMLRKQQAEAVIDARATLVHGAISLVQGTVKTLEQHEIVKMSDSEKAKLVTNMMTVLLSEESASPVVNVGSD
ncbi:MAG: SPFH domain-containing protein [Neisseria sp.]|nr:SPFH domain-containing protein [Neisseria sp.]